MNLKEKFEFYTKEELDFNINELYNSVWLELDSYLDEDIKICLNSFFTKNEIIKIYKNIIRFVFLIELVKVPKIETTKFRVRWFSQLENDPRFATFGECMEIFKNISKNLAEWLQEDDNVEILKISLTFNLLPYELPLDYTNRTTNNKRIHTIDNINWISDKEYKAAIQLRKYLLTSWEKEVFSKVLKDKIKVKTYLTDRVLTGEHKTNREKRWETHPDSVHFALRRTCVAIEKKLVSQIIFFSGFSKDIKDSILHDETFKIEDEIALCPITGEPFVYEDFLKEILHPIHGKSNFQVGHMSPLKFDSDECESGKHEASNISWISANGNRIQGSLSLSQTRNMIKTISKRYQQLNW